RTLAFRAENRLTELTKRQKERLVAEGAVFEDLLSSLQREEIKSE
ncbi:GIY-YIG nuclease family protein, partial [Escherichia coli]|nr:GIY-YIG nuclease family protein [Escherichia coli]